MDKAYRIITIEEETIPLASGADTGKILTSGILVLAVVVVAIAFFYYFRCSSRQKRIRELGGADRYCGWNLRRLDETITELEYEHTEDLEVEIKNTAPEA